MTTDIDTSRELQDAVNFVAYLADALEITPEALAAFQQAYAEGVKPAAAPAYVAECVTTFNEVSARVVNAKPPTTDADHGRRPQRITAQYLAQAERARAVTIEAVTALGWD